MRSIIILALLTTGASAQLQTTPQQRAACEPDAHRLCSDAIPRGPLAVLHCFKQKRDQLSPACAALLRQYGQ